MTKDALFRPASSTKPITATAILILMEEGKLKLTDPVSKYIPEFKNSKVAVGAVARRQRRNHRANSTIGSAAARSGSWFRP